MIYSKSLDAHIHHLELTFQQQVEYLGHVVSATGVVPDHSKIQAILDWPPPTTIKALRTCVVATLSSYEKLGK